MSDHSGHDVGHDHHPDHVVHRSIAQSGATHDMGMHAMTFHFGFEQAVLFQQWSAESIPALTITCLFFFFLAIVYEFIKAYRRVISVRHSTLSSSPPSSSSSAPAASTSTSGGVAQAPIEGDKLPAGGGEHSGNSSLSSSSQNGRQKLVRHRNDTSVYVAEQSNDRAAPTTEKPAAEIMFASRQEMMSCAHLFGTFLYTIQVIIAYLLMLAFMLFNAWICLAILLGAAVGHFFLATRAAIAVQDHPNEDHCH